MNNSINWMQDERLSDIPRYKLDFLQSLFFESKKLSDKERLPFFLSLASKTKDKNFSFTEEESKKILNILKENISPNDMEKLNRFMQMAKKR